MIQPREALSTARLPPSSASHVLPSAAAGAVEGLEALRHRPRAVLRLPLHRDEVEAHGAAQGADPQDALRPPLSHDAPASQPHPVVAAAAGGEAARSDLSSVVSAARRPIPGAACQCARAPRRMGSTWGEYVKRMVSPKDVGPVVHGSPAASRRHPAVVGSISGRDEFLPAGKKTPSLASCPKHCGARPNSQGDGPPCTGGAGVRGFSWPAVRRSFYLSNNAVGAVLPPAGQVFFLVILVPLWCA